jgi:CheY-like chemotaxis protein
MLGSADSAAVQGGRILLIDDVPSIHEDFARIFDRRTPASQFEELDADVFGEAPAKRDDVFELDSAYQGQEGLAKLEASLQEGRPYAVAFVDMRMPPGWDGLETIQHLRASDPRVQIVVCTAYSDYPWDELVRRLNAGDNLLILKKPFDPVEVTQLARALSSKWASTRHAAELERFSNVADALQAVWAAARGTIPMGEVEWTVSLRDNGAGTDPASVERIFTITPRPGPSGELETIEAGLAACKRIVESYGGRFWVETAGGGPIYYFAIPR